MLNLQARTLSSRVRILLSGHGGTGQLIAGFSIEEPDPCFHQAGLCAGSSCLKLFTFYSPATSVAYEFYPSPPGTPVGGHGSAPRMNHPAADRASAQPQHGRLHLSLIIRPKRRSLKFRFLALPNSIPHKSVVQLRPLLQLRLLHLYMRRDPLAAPR